jgi:hypothetical protein
VRLSLDVEERRGNIEEGRGEREEGGGEIEDRVERREVGKGKEKREERARGNRAMRPNTCSIFCTNTRLHTTQYNSIQPNTRRNKQKNKEKEQ